MRNVLESVVERKKRVRENKSKMTQELVERKVKKKKNIQEKKRKRVTYTNEERRENSKVKE